MKSTIPLFAGILLCSGCVSLTSFQSPEVLAPGRTSVGGGLGYTSYVPEADLLVRHGLFKGVDVGGKVSVPFVAGAVDVKWQFLKDPFLAAFDVGGSYCHAPYTFDVSDEADVFAAYPGLLVGIGRAHVAGRLLVAHTEELRSTHGEPLAHFTSWYPQVFIGGSLGERIRVIPELSFTFGALDRRVSTPVAGIGVAIMYGPTFGR